MAVQVPLWRLAFLVKNVRGDGKKIKKYFSLILLFFSMVRKIKLIFF